MTTLSAEEMNKTTEEHSKIKNCKIRKHSPDSPESYSVKKKLKTTLPDATVENEKTKESSSSTEEKNDNAILVEKHYSSLPNKAPCFRRESRILYMRNFHNWVKSMLISEYSNKVREKAYGSSLRILDLCCGKGGDLFKWLEAGISHLICIDLAEVTVQQCQDRYKHQQNRLSKGIFSAEFITADCTRVRLREKFEDPSISLDMVSCQFAFHYCFESLPQAECMMRNASECLKAGGYFIGTIPNAYDLVSRWQNCDGNSFGNDIYTVEFFCDKTKPPLFGAKYHFQLEGVVNCPEFLVYLPLFRKLALKYGLEMVLFERFDSFFKRQKDEGKRLLHKIQAFEPYPPQHQDALFGKAEGDYEHAKQYVQALSQHHKIGTLSQSEWEVSSLYAVFAFRKMKTVYNRQGKPEYVQL